MFKHIIFYDIIKWRGKNMANKEDNNAQIGNNKFFKIIVLVFNVCMALLFLYITYRTVFRNNRSIIALKPHFILIGCKK